MVIKGSGDVSVIYRTSLHLVFLFDIYFIFSIFFNFYILMRIELKLSSAIIKLEH
jgi:hypothetical protein